MAVGVAGDLFAVEVDSDVVAAPAQEAGVVVVGWAVVLPVFDVVDLADLVRGAAADAAAVAGDEAFAEASAGFAPGLAEDDVAGVFVEDAGEDFGVAGDGEGFLFGEARPVGEAGVVEPPVDGVVVGEDQQFGAGRPAGSVAVADESFERVGEALWGRGALLGVLAAEQFVGFGEQGVAQSRAGEGVECGEEVDHAVGFFADRGSAPAALPVAARLEFLVAGAFVEVVLQRPAEQVVGLLFGGAEEEPLIDGGLLGGCGDQGGGLGVMAPSASFSATAGVHSSCAATLTALRAPARERF